MASHNPDAPQENNALEKSKTKTPEDIPSEILEKLEESGLDASDSKVRRVASIAYAYRGPLPPPSVLSEYDQLVPGVASKLFESFFVEGEHRREIERHRMLGSEKRLNKGQLFSWILALVGVSISGVLTYMSPSWQTVAIALVCVGGPSVATVVARIVASQKFPKE